MTEKTKEWWADSPLLVDFNDEQRDAIVAAMNANNTKLLDFLKSQNASGYLAEMVLNKYDQLEVGWFLNELLMRVPTDERFEIMLNVEVKRAETTDASIAATKKHLAEDGWGES